MIRLMLVMALALLTPTQLGVIFLQAAAAGGGNIAIEGCSTTNGSGGTAINHDSTSLGIEVGDLMVYFVGGDTGTHTITGMSGGAEGTWTAVYEVPGTPSGYPFYALYWKIAETGDPDGTFRIEWTGADYAGVHMCRITGHDSGDPFDASNVNNDQSNSIDHTALTVNAGSAALFFFVHDGGGDTVACPTAFTDGVDCNINNANSDNGVAWEVETGTSTGAYSWVVTGNPTDEWQAITAAFNDS